MTMRLPKQLLNKKAQEHITVTVKKATELYVVGGVAYDPSVQDHVFWYAVRKYPTMSKSLQRETGTKSKSEYIQQHRPEWSEGTEPPEGYEEFYRNMPNVFEEGAPEQISKADPAKLGKSVTIIEPTQIEYHVKATGNTETDVPVVEQIIKQIRQLIWSYPVQGDFTSIRGLQGKDLQQFINVNLKKAHKTMRLQRFAQSFRIVPEATRYIDVATGTIFTSESAVQQAIADYHAAPELAAAASKGGILMNSISELLKIADMLDERGNFEDADEIVSIIQEMSEKKPEEASVDQSTEDKRAWARRAITTLVKVADSLENKGAVKEAQMADQLLVDFQQTLPQGFGFGAPRSEAPAEVSVEAPVAVEEAPVETLTEDTPFSQLEEAVVVEEPAAEAAPEEPVAEGPSEVEVEEPTEPEPSYDEVSIDEFKEMIEGMKWRHSQGPKRQRYEEILQGVEQAKTYYQAYREWMEHAHKKFEDEPIRIKID